MGVSRHNKKSFIWWKNIPASIYYYDHLVNRHLQFSLWLLSKRHWGSNPVPFTWESNTLTTTLSLNFFKSALVLFTKARQKRLSSSHVKGAVDNFSTFPTLAFQSGIICAPLSQRQRLGILLGIATGVNKSTIPPSSVVRAMVAAFFCAVKWAFLFFPGRSYPVTDRAA